MAPSSSSSSEEEDMTKFIEAADNSVYNTYLRKDYQEDQGTPLIPSLRNVDEEEGIDQHKHKGLNVTQAFQNHVARHLTQLLDSKLLLDDDSKDSVSTSGCQLSPFRTGFQNSRKIALARRKLEPSRLTNIGEQVTTTVLSSKSPQSTSGVRLFGASAVFLSNLDIVPANNPQQRRKRGRKLAQFSSGSESSSEDSDSSITSDDLKKCSAAAVSPDWVLSGAATKGWASKEGKVERCFVGESGVILPANEKDSHCVYGTTKNPENIVNKDKETLSDSAKDDLFALRFRKKNKKKKRRALSLDGDTLAASFNAVVCISADSPCDSVTYGKSKKKSRKKKRKKDHNSEDATTETTEEKDIGEGRKKKRKKRKKRKKKDGIVMGIEKVEVPRTLEGKCEDPIMVKITTGRKKKKKNKRNKDDPNHKSCFKINKPVFKPSSKHLRKVSCRMDSLDGTPDGTL